MSPEEEHDIRESFHAMDEEKTGEIDTQRFHTLCLGLGHDVELEELERLMLARRNNGIITVEDALEILSKVRLPYYGYDVNFNGYFAGVLKNKRTQFDPRSGQRMQFSRRDRRQELDKCFQLVVDSNHSGKITPQQLMKLSAEMGEPLSLEEASAMMPNGDWSQAEFERLMSSSTHR